MRRSYLRLLPPPRSSSCRTRRPRTPAPRHRPPPRARAVRQKPRRDGHGFSRRRPDLRPRMA
eukprot:5443382-Prymnesium_polylepis.1